MAVETKQAEVLRVRSLSPSVRELILSPLGHRVSFKPGQWISLHLPVGQRPPLIRAYSMAEPQSASGHLVLVFDRVPQGLGSRYLFTLKEGDKVLMVGPYGKFVLPEPLTQDLLLIGRYTGIVPLHCMIKHLFTCQVTQRVTLVYGAPGREDLIYHDEFSRLATIHDIFRYAPTLLGGDKHTEGEVRPEIEVVASMFEGRRDFLPMICGVKAFVNPLRAYFTERGFGRREMRHEIYDG